MKLKKFYDEIVKKGIEADPRGKKAISDLLGKRQKEYKKLIGKDKEFYDQDSLTNPFFDSRILNGDPNAEIKSIIVGIDAEGPELLLVDRLKDKGTNIDLVVGHHPEGRAYAQFYEVMDIQADVFKNKGISLSCADDLLKKRKLQVERRVSAANHQRPVDIAKLLNLNFMCMHTPADNLACQYIENLMSKKKPKILGEVLDILLEVPEYRDAALNNNPPKIFVGDKSARVSKIHVEFTGGTEGPEEIYQKLSNAGIDTIIAMHQSESHVKKCREANINVVVASHIASDNIGVNLMLDYLLSKGKFKVYEFSGFKRVSRKIK